MSLTVMLAIDHQQFNMRGLHLGSGCSIAADCTPRELELKSTWVLIPPGAGLLFFFFPYSSPYNKSVDLNQVPQGSASLLIYEVKE